MFRRDHNDLEDLGRREWIVVIHEAWPARCYAVMPGAAAAPDRVLASIDAGVRGYVKGVVSAITSLNVGQLLSKTARETIMVELGKTEERAFISEIETWGSGGIMLDVLTLTDGSILVITEEQIARYANRTDFDSGHMLAATPRHEHARAHNPEAE